MLGRLFTNLFQAFPRNTTLSQLSSTIVDVPVIANPWNLMIARTRMRYHFPYPKERKRIKKHGWVTRMSTLSGRKILMRRILKGKHVLSH